VPGIRPRCLVMGFPRMAAEKADLIGGELFRKDNLAEYDVVIVNSSASALRAMAASQRNYDALTSKLRR